MSNMIKEFIAIVIQFIVIQLKKIGNFISFISYKKNIYNNFFSIPSFIDNFKNINIENSDINDIKNNIQEITRKMNINLENFKNNKKYFESKTYNKKIDKAIIFFQLIINKIMSINTYQYKFRNTDILTKSEILLEKKLIESLINESIKTLSINDYKTFKKYINSTIIDIKTNIDNISGKEVYINLQNDYLNSK